MTNNKNIDVAVRVENLSKTFKVPHEKRSSLKAAAINLFAKRSYNVFKALENINFEVKKGEFFGIVGRNGCGKSTLLKILAGIYIPTTGEIKINGKVSPFLELGVGFNPELTGKENVFLGGSILGLTKTQIEERYDQIVEFSELEEFIDMKLKNYSSGMQVRLAFSLSVHVDAEILLMDEVLAVGDINFQNKCLAEFNNYKKMGKTVILVTHDIGTVKKYCDQAMLLRNGKIVKIGKAEEVGNKYIYQNMSDEEIRINKNEKKNKTTTGNSSGRKKIAEITKVEILDKKGKEKNIFMTGEPLDIKISFLNNAGASTLNFGIGWHSTSGGQVFGYNTQMDRVNIDKDKKSITLHLNEIPILKGQYLINVACWGDVEQNHYDYKPGYKNIQIITVGPESNYRGVVAIKHDWELN